MPHSGIVNFAFKHFFSLKRLQDFENTPYDMINMKNRDLSRNVTNITPATRLSNSSRAHNPGSFDHRDLY